MGVWLVKRSERGFDILQDDGAHACSIKEPSPDAMGYWRAVQMARARIMGRYEDNEPRFAAHSGDAEAVAFAEMANA